MTEPIPIPPDVPCDVCGAPVGDDPCVGLTMRAGKLTMVPLCSDACGDQLPVLDPKDPEVRRQWRAFRQHRPSR
jgi:hypothetical protein